MKRTLLAGIVTAAIAASLAAPALADSSTTCTKMGMFVNCNTTDDTPDQSVSNGFQALAAAIAARRQEREERKREPRSLPPADLSTGNGFTATCDLKPPVDNLRFGLCYGYLAGFVSREMLNGDGAQFCFPQGANNKQMMDVVLKFIEDNPADRARPTSMLTHVALIRAFPCQRPNTAPPGG